MASTKNIFITFALLIFSIIFFGLSSVDYQLQDLFFNFNTKYWILTPYDQPYEFIFYSGIKKLLIIISILFLFSLAFIKLNKTIKSYKRGILVIVLSAIFVPATIGVLKGNTNMPCPRDEIAYGGLYPKTKVWESFPQEVLARGQQLKCWPAGHASGGFALMSFFFLFKKRRNKYLALGAALIIGWAMGTYKMIIGDHFLSHTVITMILAWLIILIIARATKVEEVKEHGHTKNTDS
ncbi:phosphatase PAP2 family protein [Sulfurimonas sp. C5]|uniref:phosphatase PAP2 family protein n=1 Tax=Sulfurimonas sp. C5 TaxID=3036947 RepID=UPI002455E084|nr:phosphatase PAP2 family protein [Sulfurimonas sp. C5]MDH4945245.1 phosphatase PAP2 family protein [Sulfurimonas sp. C5]